MQRTFVGEIEVVDVWINGMLDGYLSLSAGSELAFPELVGEANQAVEVLKCRKFEKVVLCRMF